MQTCELKGCTNTFQSGHGKRFCSSAHKKRNYRAYGGSSNPSGTTRGVLITWQSPSGSGSRMSASGRLAGADVDRAGSGFTENSPRGSVRNVDDVLSGTFSQGAFSGSDAQPGTPVAIGRIDVVTLDPDDLSDDEKAQRFLTFLRGSTPPKVGRRKERVPLWGRPGDERFRGGRP